MPASNRSEGRVRAAAAEEGVLSKLPRTRPQRATRRRIAARASTGRQAGADTKPPGSAPSARSSAPSGARRSTRSAAGARAHGGARAAAPGASAAKARSTQGAAQRKQQRRPSSARRPHAALPPAPRQGFESESERASGPVQPPGGAELLASAAEIVSEVTKAGLSAGERVIRDVLSRLPLS